MVTINIGRKEAVFFGVVILVLGLVGMGVAFGGTTPSDMGHSIGELEGMQATIDLLQGQIDAKQDIIVNTCSGANKAVKTINPDGTVTCEDDDFGSGILQCISRDTYYSSGCGGGGYVRTSLSEACGDDDNCFMCCRVV